MNNTTWGRPRKRNQKLLIVEGDHEQNQLYQTIFRCFPELTLENVWIYGTNIYLLYNAIVKQYEEGWYADQTVDVDLPYLVSKMLQAEKTQYKEDFTDIYLVFDYERHDPNFSEEKIVRLQRYFNDSTDVGKLYVNYPMVESYQDLRELPDPTYIDRKVSANMQRGSEYKNSLRKSMIRGYMAFPTKLQETLSERFQIHDERACQECVEGLLGLSNEDTLSEEVRHLLSIAMEEDNVRTACGQMEHELTRIGYASKNQTYWEYMREIFQRIILHNILKAYRIQTEQLKTNSEDFRQCFEQLDAVQILQRQNEVSRDRDKGFIWVLNSCVMLVADYNFSLVAEEDSGAVEACFNMQ